MMVLFIVVVTFSFASLWLNSPLKSDNIVELVVASQTISEIKSGESLNSINFKAQSDNSREALDIYGSWFEGIESLNRLHSTPSFKELKEFSKVSHSSLEEMISLPEVAKILSVLRQKVEGFESFVVRNNWRTLTRISGATKARLEFDSTRERLFFSRNRLAQLSSQLESDFERMRSVTVNSVLSQDNKDRILNRIEQMRPELDMLSSYIDRLEFFESNIAKTETAFNQWINDIELGIHSRISRLESIGDYLYIGLLSFALLCLITFVTGQLIYKYTIKSSRRKIEELTLETIRDGLIPLNSNVSMDFSQAFSQELYKYREYVHKRMSFGSVFQEGMPFSTIMLDNNLNLAWANSLFYEVWGLEERTAKEEPLSWDYLQQFTNLGEDDPVLTALNENVAGIYQIQVRTRKNEEGLPYEMYVSPVDYADQSRIMIFFYPLRSLQETISHQVKSIVGPVSRTLDLLATNQFHLQDLEKLRNDFQIAGIENIFEKFKMYDEVTTEQTNQKDNIISKLQDQCKSLLIQLEDINTISERQKNQLETCKKYFMTVKSEIVSQAELREKFQGLMNDTIIDSQNVKARSLSLVEHGVELSGATQEFLTIVSKTSDVSKQLKILREETERLVSKLRQSFHSLTSNSEGLGDNRNQQVLSRLKNDLASVGELLGEMGKKQMNIDVSFGKVEMIFQNNQTFDYEKLQETLSETFNKIDDTSLNFKYMTENFYQKDEEIVKTLKNFHEAFINLNRLQHEVASSSSCGIVPVETLNNNDSLLAEVDGAPL